MSLLDDVSIVVTPNGYKAGELYAVIPVPVEGSEEVTNGDFATDTDWSKGTGWTISGDSANCDGTQTGTSHLYQDAGLTIGTRYKATATISNYSAGNIRIQMGGSTYGGWVGTDGETTFVGVQTFDQRVYVQADVNFIGSIDNLSVKEYTAADMDVTRATAATRVDEDGLVNYAEILGGEDVIDGDFPSGTTDWTSYETGSSTVSIDNGAILNIDASNSNVGVYQENIFTSGKNYKIVLSMKASTSFDAEIVESQGAATQTTIGTVSLTTSYQDFVFYFTGTGTNDLFIHRLYGETAGQSQQIYIQSASVKEADRDNVPRIDYTGGGCPHILAEPQSTNLVVDSSTFSFLSNATLTSGITSPTGETNAFKLVEDSTNSIKLAVAVNNTATVADTTLSSSVYVKAGERTKVRVWGYHLSNQNFFVEYDLSDNSYLNSGGSNTTVEGYSITDISDGWKRISVQGKKAVSTYSWDVAVSPLDASGNVTYTGDGTSGLYVFGGQMEQLPYTTSYIPTSGSTVTRNQDIFTRDGIGSLINSTEGVLFLESAALANDGTDRGISISDGTLNNSVNLFYWSDNKIRFLLLSGSATQVTIDYTLTTTIFNKIALKWKLNDFALWVNGVEVGSDNTGTSPLSMNTFEFAQGGGAAKFFSKVKQLQVYDTALTDEQLLQLTGESGTDFYESYAEMASALTYTIQ